MRKHTTVSDERNTLAMYFSKKNRLIPRICNTSAADHPQRLGTHLTLSYTATKTYVAELFQDFICYKKILVVARNQ